jgi:anti-sigma-K factor RskA
MSSGDLGAPPPGTIGAETEHPRDLLASYALGLLDGEEQRQVEEHVRGCPSCTAEVQEVRAALDALPLAASPVAPPPAARDALMKRVSVTVRGAPGAQPNALGAPSPGSGGWTGAWGGVAWGGVAGWAMAVACAALAIASTWQLVQTRTEVAALRQDRAALESRLQAQVDALRQLDPQATRATPLRGQAPAPGIQGVVVYQPNSPTALAVLEHLPPLDAGKTYQLWLIQGSTPVSAGTFSADSGGTGTLVIRAPNNIGAYSGFGLTAEPIPGVASPTGAILATGAL